ncbi:MAG: substrate-binding domain-containing protein [Collinsella sp.]
MERGRWRGRRDRRRQPQGGSGTRATFEAAVFGEEKNTYKPAQPEQDKSGDVQTLMGSTDNAISYIDFSHFDDSKFTAIKVGGVEPASENVLDNSFPIWATEHMYCAKDADDATKAFLEYMLSDDVQSRARRASRASSRSPRWPW